MQQRFGMLQYAIIGLTIATAAIHLALTSVGGLPFVLNGAGYLVLLALLYWPSERLDPYRSMVRWVLIAYTIVTIVAWITFGARSPIAYVDKAIEIVLVGLLWYEGQTQTKNRSSAEG